jgi:transketolase
VNLKAVGTHSGISIGEDGPSQMSIEDLALACALPGFCVFSPCDEVSMKAIIHLVAEHVGPVFVRAARAKSPIVYGADTKFTVGGSNELIAGKDVTLMSHGLLVAEAIRAAETLEGEGISARVIDMYSIKPLDRGAIERASRETGAIVVAEEHLIEGGLGVRVAQVTSETVPCVMEYVGVNDTYAESGTPDELLDKYGLRAVNIAAAARKAIGRKGAR